MSQARSTRILVQAAQVLPSIWADPRRTGKEAQTPSVAPPPRGHYMWESLRKFGPYIGSMRRVASRLSTPADTISSAEMPEASGIDAEASDLVDRG